MIFSRFLIPCYTQLGDAMKRNTLGEKFKYRFDNLMSRGPGALIGWLALISVVVILAISAAVILAQVGPEDKDFLNVAWMSLMRTLDAGTMGGDEGSWPFLLLMFAVTVAGVFFISSLIG